MGKKRRPPTKSSNIIHGTGNTNSSNAHSNNSNAGTNNNPNMMGMMTASMNGISLPPAIANQIIAAMSRGGMPLPTSTGGGGGGGMSVPSSAGMPNLNHATFGSSNPNNSGSTYSHTGGNMSSTDSKQYLDEMGRFIAAHMNQSINGNFGVRFTGGGTIPHNNNTGGAANNNTGGGAASGGPYAAAGGGCHHATVTISTPPDGKTIYGPAPPPPPPLSTTSGSGGGDGGGIDHSWTKITTGDHSWTRGIDPAAFQNLQQVFGSMANSNNSAGGMMGNSGGGMMGSFSFTAGKSTSSSGTSKGGGSGNMGGGKGYNANNPEDVKTMMSLFSELMGMTSAAAGGGGGNYAGGGAGGARNVSFNNGNDTTTSSSNATANNDAANNTVPTNAPTNEELAREFYEKFIACPPSDPNNDSNNYSKQQQQAMLHSTDPLALRKAAFAAGVNVAMQQQLMREQEMNSGGGAKTSEKKEGSSLKSGGTKGGKSGANAAAAGGGTNNNSSVNPNLQPVFSMIFGNDGTSNLPPGGIPPIPPPPNGWPAGASAAAAAAAFASALTMKDHDGNSNTNANHPNNTQYYNPSDFAGAFSSPELGSPAWLEYYFEEYARTHAQARTAANINNNNNLPQDRPNKSSDCPAHFEYAFEEEEEERIQRERQILIEADNQAKEAAAQKKKDKKARKKERAKKEAEAKSAAAAKKKREKTITSWRSRVVAACTSGDVTKMEVLLSESPYKNFTFTPNNDDFDNEEDDDNSEQQPQTQQSYLIRQLEWFFPNVLQKYPELEPGQIPFENNKARELLAKYIMQCSFDTVCYPGLNSLRNPIHTAAYKNDVNFIKWVIELKTDAFMKQVEVFADEEELENPYCECLDILCEDAGWSSLHYAVASGSKDVVEALLEADQFLTSTRSDLELTCLNSTGYGITARELAHVLQSGAIHEDISCDGDVLDEIVEDRIVCATTSEKNAYMRTLRLLTERLEDVEINGYSPLQKAEDQKKSTAKNSSKAESQTSATSKKSKKKKKKQQQQQQQQNASSVPAPNLSNETEKKESKPNPVNAPEDDLSDPVAVALLGMGFTAEQITSAAKALGGFERATADDMVMWILSGGQVNNDDQEEQEQDNSTEFDDSHHSKLMSLPDMVKKIDAKAKTDAEELARKRQEKIAAAERAAAKREEQRRIRREWNEREQARQEIEKNAKIAEVVAKKKQAEMQKMQAELAGSKSLPAIPPTVHVGGGKGKSKSGTGPPQTIATGGKKGAMASNMGIPKGPNVKAPKILARPNQALPAVQQGGASAQPLFPGQSSNVLPTTNQQAAAAKSRNLSQPRHQQPLPPPPASYSHQVMPSTNYYNHSSASSSFGYDSTYGKDAGAMPLMSGGNTYHSVQQDNAPPPGFKSSVLPPSPAANDSSLNAAANPLGEIRATAREFVPTSFAPVHESAPSGLEFNAVPSMSSQPATVSHTSPPDGRSNANEVSLLLDPVSSLLNAAISASVNKSDSPVQSATSSITGFSGTVEEATTSRVGSALTFESAVGGIQTSSILESITYSGGQESGIGGLGSGGIWGDSNNNQSSNLGGLVGLNFSSFLNSNGGDQKNDGQSSSLGNTWGTSTGGSIW